jgi:hypothetical protein
MGCGIGEPWYLRERHIGAISPSRAGPFGVT